MNVGIYPENIKVYSGLSGGKGGGFNLHVAENKRME